MPWQQNETAAIGTCTEGLGAQCKQCVNECGAAFSLSTQTPTEGIEAKQNMLVKFLKSSSNKSFPFCLLCKQMLDIKCSFQYAELCGLMLQKAVLIGTVFYDSFL